MRMESWVAFDWAFETLQSFPGHAIVLQDLVKAIDLAVAAQKLEQPFADHDVVGRGVVVELLMPLLQEMAGHFLDVVAVHDVENLIPHLLSFAASPNRRQNEPD